MSGDPRGAGSSGGLLFLAVMLVLGYLLISAVAGLLKWLIGVAFVVVIIAMGVRIISRR